MTQEEKAKAYDKVREKIVIRFGSNVAKEVFSEYEESEDERIRKALVELVHDTTGDSLWVDYNVHKEDALAWLEEQGEHANFRNKIQIGDKVTRNEDGVLVNLSQLKRVAKKDEKQVEQKLTDKVEPKFKVGDTVTVKPMSCHGKVFKGEPFKIVDIIEDNYVSDDGKAYSISLQGGWELVKQKPAWSKEDNYNYNIILYLLNNECVGAADKRIAIEWFKFLKARVELQPKQEWSEEDENRINRLINYFEDKESFSAEDDIVYANWLKSIRPCQRWKPSDEQMHYLSWIANVKLGDSVVEQEVSKHLNELLEDLKKLGEDKK